MSQTSEQKLRTALEELVGVSTKDELETMVRVIGPAAATDPDCKLALNAVQCLLDTLESPTDSMGIPACRGPLCAPSDHHPLCRNHRPETIPATGYTDVASDGGMDPRNAADATEHPDTARLDKLHRVLFRHHWNGVVGAGHRINWSMQGGHWQVMQDTHGDTFRDAIDRMKD